MSACTVRSKKKQHHPQKATSDRNRLQFDRFRNEFNNLRPHESLGQRTPASIYTVSPREYPLRQPEVEYPEGMIIRRVRSTGCIRFRGRLLFVSESLIGEPVALEHLDDHHLALYYGPIPLSVLDSHTCTWLPADKAEPILKELHKELPGCV